MVTSILEVELQQALPVGEQLLTLLLDQMVLCVAHNQEVLPLEGRPFLIRDQVNRLTAPLEVPTREVLTQAHQDLLGLYDHPVVVDLVQELQAEGLLPQVDHLVAEDNKKVNRK